jgi:DivIVA domain-containing protein
MARVLTASDVEKATFGQTQFREGYDEREVDQFLDAVVVALRYYADGGVAASAPLSADRAAEATFSVTSFRRGYDRNDIDALLGDVVHTLRTLEGGRAVSSEGTSTAPPREAIPNPVTRPPASAGSRLLRFLRGDKG